MTKIGIITVSRTNNFGAELQAYALQKKMENLGYKAEVIDYLYYKHKNHKPTSRSKSEIEFSTFVKFKKNILYRIILPLSEIVLPIFHFATKRRMKNFNYFHEINTNFSKRFESIETLYEYKHDYDVYITGSDQVWNPSTFTSLKPYFLDFAPSDKIKMSYAPSFGVSEIEDKYYSFYKEQLNKLDYISVREKSGCDLVKKISSRDSTVVLDPTLLLSKSEWKSVIKNGLKHKPEKYILIYQLHDSEVLITIALELAKQLKLPILSLCKRSFFNKKYNSITNIVDAGPSEFIELFYDAAFVITNSFHGTVFSTNFNVPFFSILNPDRKNNSRMINFLKMTGLEERIVWENVSKLEMLDSLLGCDFNDANQILDKERVSSLNYLKSSLNK